MMPSYIFYIISVKVFLKQKKIVEFFYLNKTNFQKFEPGYKYNFLVPFLSYSDIYLFIP